MLTCGFCLFIIIVNAMHKTYKQEGGHHMQFYKGELKLEDLYYRDREAVQVVACKLNTKYWNRESSLGLHVVMSRVTIGMAVFLIMFEGQEADVDTIDTICQEYSKEISDESDLPKVQRFKEKISYSEINLKTYCNLLTEEWLERMYEDKAAIMEILHIDYSKYVCDEGLLPPLCDERQSIKRFISKDELSRIRNSRIQQGMVVYQPVHYIVEENNDDVAEQIDNEIIFELRKAQRITSRRFIKISDSDIANLEKYRYKIQNLNNLDGGVVIVLMNHCDFGDASKLIRAVYSEDNNYIAKYEVIFHVSEGDKKIIDAIGEICSLWPFVKIRNKRLTKAAAIKQLYEIAMTNNSPISKDDCLAILKNQKDYSYDEVNELFRKWFLTDYTINTFHPQYRERIDEYYRVKENEKDALKELDRLVGLYEVKALCRKIVDFYGIQAMRKMELEDEEGIGMHMIFTGNPGTAKTTVARLLARIFKQKGILSKGELIEVGRKDLVGKYVGWTAQIVKDYFERAKGSVLFIDEAYSLIDGEKGSFGTEAINTIVQEMENRRDEVVVIFAGYKKEMYDFVSSNSGLKSRISFSVDFPDYSGEELYKILKIFAEKNHFELKEDVKKALMATLEKQDTRNGNGRIVRNEFEKAKLRQAERLMKMPKAVRKEKMFTLIGEDFGGAL